MQRFVLGTAGHVDHGKTALVKALTGVDTDRLPEEKRRGLTIELGFAPLSLAPDLFAGIVDVPGHEGFVETMVAGATGVDAVLLVVAADEGVRPQTLEHLEIVRLLGIGPKVAALTKIDLLSSDEISTRAADLEKRLGIQVIPVSARSLTGLEALRAAIARMAEGIRPKREKDPLFLPIDRVFSRTGVGTIVTGTLNGGRLKAGEELAARPGRLRVTVRALQIFGTNVSSVEASTRLAVNVTGPDREKLERGLVLCRPEDFRSTRRIHVRVDWLPNAKLPRSGSLRILAGTAQLTGRWLPLSESTPSLGELRLQRDGVFRAGERFVLRTESPPRTLGGGTVLDPHPELSLRKSRLADLSVAESEKARLRLFLELAEGTSAPSALARRLSRPIEEILTMLEGEKIVRVGPERVLLREKFDAIQDLLRKTIQERGEVVAAELSMDRRISKEPPLVEKALEQLIGAGEARLEFGRVYSKDVPQAAIHPAVGRVRGAGLEPPSLERLSGELKEPVAALRAAFAHAANLGTVVRLADDLYCGSEAVAQVRTKLVHHFEAHATLDISQWKTLTGVSRKYSVPLLEHFDREKTTLCRADRTRIPGPNLKKVP